MKDRVENVRSSSMLPNTWTMTIFASLKYFNKMFHNTLKVENIIHNLVKEFIRIGGSMVETTFKCGVNKIVHVTNSMWV
jgi:hypothetical protein